MFGSCTFWVYPRRHSIPAAITVLTLTFRGISQRFGIGFAAR